MGAISKLGPRDPMLDFYICFVIRNMCAKFWPPMSSGSAVNEFIPNFWVNTQNRGTFVWGLPVNVDLYT